MRTPLVPQGSGGAWAGPERMLAIVQTVSVIGETEEGCLYGSMGGFAPPQAIDTRKGAVKASPARLAKW